MTRPSVDQIYAAVTSVTSINRVFIRNRSRRTSIVRARALVAMAMREHRAMSFPEIGIELGRSHSTVIGLLRTHAGDSTFRRDFHAVSDALNAHACAGAVQP